MSSCPASAAMRCRHLRFSVRYFTHFRAGAALSQDRVPAYPG